LLRIRVRGCTAAATAAAVIHIHRAAVEGDFSYGFDGLLGVDRRGLELLEERHHGVAHLRKQVPQLRPQPGAGIVGAVIGTAVFVGGRLFSTLVAAGAVTSRVVTFVVLIGLVGLVVVETVVVIGWILAGLSTLI